MAGIVQTTANLWEVLCRDLQTQRETLPTDQHPSAAEQFVASARQVLRPESPRLCDALEIAGDVCQAAAAEGEATRHFATALKLAIELTNLLSAARISAKLAYLHTSQGDDEKATAYFEEALSFYDQAGDHSQHTPLLSQLAAVWRRRGDFDAAQRCYENALRLSVSLHGPNHPETAMLHNNLGVCLIEARKYREAETAHMQALGVRESNFGANHPDVAQSMANLAVVYHGTGQYQKAEKYYLASLEIYRKFRTDAEPEVRTILDNYAALKKKTGAGVTQEPVK